MQKAEHFITIEPVRKKKHLEAQYRAKNHRKQGSSKTRRNNLRLGISLPRSKYASFYSSSGVTWVYKKKLFNCGKLIYKS